MIRRIRKALTRDGSVGCTVWKLAHGAGVAPHVFRLTAGSRASTTAAVLARAVGRRRTAPPCPRSAEIPARLQTPAPALDALELGRHLFVLRLPESGQSVRRHRGGRDDGPYRQELQDVRHRAIDALLKVRGAAKFYFMHFDARGASAGVHRGRVEREEAEDRVSGAADSTSCPTSYETSMNRTTRRGDGR